MFQILEPAFLPQPDMVANGQLPGESDIDPGFDGYVATDARPEQAQRGAFQGGKTEWTQAEQNEIDQQPNGFLQHTGPAVKFSSGIN